MKAAKWLTLLLYLIFSSLVLIATVFAGSTSKLSNIFTLDTRIEDKPPVDGWQILTNNGDTYNEDLVIDNHGKVWCFYFRSPGANQPIYLKIFKTNGYVYKREQIVGYSSGYNESKFNSIRAAENDSTGDVWVAIQGNDGGYFVVYDSTGNVKQDSTVLSQTAFSPKIVQGENGKMWFSWHTQYDGGPDSEGKIVCYSANGELSLGPNTIGRHTYIVNTDIAVDDSNRVWTVFEVNQSGDYSTKFSIFNRDLTLYIDGNIVSNSPIPINPQRQIFSDVINQRIWILAKDTTIAQQQLHLYALDGSKIKTIENSGDCGFIRNEKNFLEVLRFNDQNPQNKVYESNLYQAQNGNFYSSETKFDSTFQFVRNGIAYNKGYPSLKVYGVQFDTNQTKLRFEQVSPGLPEISVKSIQFDTTKITPTYKKQRNVKVQNIGNAILEVYHIIPNDSQHFSVSDTAFQVLPAGYQNIIVEFTPNTTDSVVDYILFLSNDPSNDSLKVTVSGKGYNPTNPKITVDKDSLIFDTIILGNAQTKHIYIYNDDIYEPLKIYSITSSNPQFIPDSSGFTLSPKKGKYVAITFKPTEIGTIAGVLTINNNDTTNSNLKVPLQGTGLRFGTPQIAVNPDTLNFGEVALGHQKSLYLEIENKGNSNLEIYNISPADTQFSTNIKNFTISPYSKYYVLVTYQVKRLGEVTTTITIENSDHSKPQYSVFVRGMGRNVKPPMISISPDSLNYGIIPINSSKTKYFWINNPGEEPLYIQDLYSNDQRFVVYQTKFIVNPGYPHAVSVTFTPDEPDTITGTLTVVSNDITNDTSHVQLIGIGRSLTLPQMELSTPRIDFGSVALNQSLTKTFWIHNKGEQLLEVSKIELSNANPSFSIYPTSVNVPYGQYRTVYVTFSPKETGPITGKINITSNDQPTQSIILQGTGRDPRPQQIFVSHNKVDFDSVAISKSKSHYIWIKNIGETQLTVHNIFTTNDNFSVNVANLQLNPGQSQYVLITFTPTIVMAYLDTLVIHSDDPDNKYKYIILNGSGRQLFEQNIQLSSQSLSFGEIAITQQRTMGLTVYNTGEKELVISNISNRNTAFSIDKREFVISPESYHTMDITFSPQSLITYLDTLNIYNNDPDSPIVMVPLSGSGRNLKNQKIAVFPDSLHFGSIGISLTSSQTIQIRNDGEIDLEIDSIKVDDSHFSIKGDTSLSIRPGFSNFVTVLFRPDSTGNFSGSLTIYNNDPDSPAYRIPVIGTGRELLNPSITIYPQELNFEDVAISKSKTTQLYVGNDGEKELTVSSIVSSDDQFKVEPTAFSVQPGSNQMLTVTFQPVAIDTFFTEFTVMSNDPDSSVAVVPVQGIGRPLKEPQLSYSPETLNFGKVYLGNSVINNVTIQNSGDLPLELFEISTHDSHFVVNIDSALIQGGQNINIAVTFIPSDTLDYESILEIRSNDPNNYFARIQLKGKGQANVQQIVVSPSYLDFKDVRVYLSATKYLWVSNFGDKPLAISNITSDNPRFSPQLTGFTLEPSQNRQVPVTFTPDALQTFSGRLIIVSDDPVADSLIVPLTGIGRDSLDQEIAVSSDSLDFGTVAIHNTKTLSLTINNTGEKYLNIYSVTTTNKVFTTNLTSFQIMPMGGQTLLIAFTPINTINYSDTLLIVSNDPFQDTMIVKLKGIGRNPAPQKIAVSDSVLNFGTVPTDRTKSLSFWITNQGEKNLEIYDFAISDSQFSVHEKWLIVKPGQTHNITVTFSPVRSDSINATLTINHNDSNRPQQIIDLRGRGIFYQGARISILSEAINFGNTLVGATKKLTLWIKNSSQDSTLKITSFSLTHEAFRILQSTLTIPPGKSGAVQVVFKPHAIGNHSARVTIYSNDKYQSTLDFWIYGYGMMENVGQSFVADLGWKDDGYTPVGDIFSPEPHTESLLSEGPDRAWFIKDINLYQEPESAVINLCFDDEIQLFINGSLVLTETSTQPFHWNIVNYNVKSYLKLGRNRISILVWNKVELLGGFDCELIVDGASKIKRGDQNWAHPDATWWYYGTMGQEYPAPPIDNPYGRPWFHIDYGLAGIDTVAANWTFEPSGNDTLYDNTPYGQQAILHNITWIKGVIGQAMQFSGLANSYVELYTNLNRVPQTIELWFNCYEQRSYAQNIITNKGTGQFGLGLFIDQNMRLGVYYYNGQFLTDFVIRPNTWYFVSTQYKFDQLLIYINNNLIGTHPYGQGNPVGKNYCYLGGNPLQQDTTTAFYGAIDELKVKGTATAPTPIQQVAKISIVPPDSAIRGDEVELNFDIFPTPFQIISGTFQYTWGGSDVYHSKSLASRDSTFESPLKVIVPSDSITVRGLKYRILLQTEYGTVYYPDYAQNEGEFSWIEVSTDKESSQVALPDKIHRMISIPYVLNDPAIEAVLVDNLGAKNPYKWRLFEWSQADTNYIAFDDSAWQNSNGFTRGKSYWLITSEPQTFDAGSGRSPENMNYRINLNSGWNMIGNPFPYPVRWSDIEKTSNLISDPVYRSTIDSIGWIYNIETLNPWEGYFVWNGDDNNRSLIVPPKEALRTPLKKQTSLAHKFLEKYSDISILFAANIRCGKFIDSENLFGVSETGADGYDDYDFREAPAIGDYVSLWIDNRKWEKFGGAYTVDIRKNGANGYTWNLIIEYSINNPEEMLKAKFQQIIDIPDNWLIYLLDLSEDIAINLQDQSEFSIKPVADKLIRKGYKLVIGTEEYVLQNSENIPLIPLEFELFQNYPNPFNAITTISFNLPKRMHVSVKIYNILGQLVKILVEEEVRGGNHKILWDGKNNQGNLVSTGLYIVRLNAKDKVAIKKLLLIK